MVDKSHLIDNPLVKQELVLKDGSILAISEVKRYLPDRRIVGKGIWNGQAVYAKVFIGKGAEKYAFRDKQGVECLAQAGIATPALLHVGVVSDSGANVLVFKALEQGEDTEVKYKHLLECTDRFELALKLVRVVAQHHNANLLQTDLYLKNFFISDYVVYTLDGDGIRKYARLSRRSGLKNLSVLLSKFDVLEVEDWMSRLLNTYAETRCFESEPKLADVKNLVNRHRIKVADQYADKKVFRSCTDVQVHQQGRCYLAISSHFYLQSLPETPQDCDRLIASQLLIKNGNTCTVALVKIDDLDVVIKRYNIKSFWHGISRALRQTRAARSWANAHRLALLGIRTAAPIALFELRRFGFLKGRAYFLSEYVQAPDVSEFFTQVTDPALQAEVINNVVCLFYRLYLLKISHGDTKSSNIKIVNGSPLLIDLDSMQQHYSDWIALRAHVRDLKRFMQNWQAMPALYNTFVAAFNVVYADHQALRLARII